MGGGGQRGHDPSNLAPNKFQKGPSGIYRMQKNLLEARALPRTPLLELTGLPNTPYLVSRGLAAFSPKTHSPLSALWASPPTLYKALFHHPIW